MFYVVYFSQFDCLSRSFFPNFGREPFLKIAGKSPVFVPQSHKIDSHALDFPKNPGRALSFYQFSVLFYLRLQQ